MKVMRLTCILFCMILFAGCTKKELGPACKTCVTTIKTTYHPDATKTEKVCDWKWQEEDGKRTSVKTMEGIYYVYIISTTVCKVMIEGRQTPSKIHETYQEAEKEAIRLVNTQRVTAYVLEAVAKIELNDVKVTRLE